MLDEIFKIIVMVCLVVGTVAFIHAMWKLWKDGIC